VIRSVKNAQKNSIYANRAERSWKITMDKQEYLECLIWLQQRMDECDEKEAYQYDYKIVNRIYNFMRSKEER
jgi:hypothetical protein